MDETKNPYPEFIVDESSGIQVRDTRHEIWGEGFKAGCGNGTACPKKKKEADKKK